ncbi:cytochrome b [Falsirhodobacter sp. alg1]|uniref:cytochrome b n=1 Tax=Falsirhodobacter sp. alg1 TaxID=1472418 RepID=UPI0005ED6480|nr:cytochrome b [Falsirhodobacter sp. alg1]
MFRNTEHGYGLIAITLHWIVAFAFIANYALIFGREWFLAPRSDLGRTLISTHMAIGVSVIVFVALRIIWKLVDRQPSPPKGSRLEHLAASTVHLILYAVMIVIPLTGYLGTGGSARLFFLFDLPPFRETWIFTTIVEGWFGITWESFESVMDFIHKTGGARVVWVLIALHISAALYHQFVRRDNILRRMTNPRTSRFD